jgi:hypothetical protein
MRGSDVLHVQTKLKALGYDPGPLDSQYGVLTSSAVKEFERDHKLLPVNGFVTAVVLAVIDGAVKPKPKPTKPTVGLAFLTQAVKFIGIKEDPAGSNNQQFSRWFYSMSDAAAADAWTPAHPGPPWCNIYISKNTADCGIVICQGFNAAGVVAGKGCAYVPSTEAWLRSRGFWMGKVLPEDGDLIPYNWDGGEPDHIGFGATEATLRRLVPHYLDAAIGAYGPLGQGEFWSVEGNTSTGNDSNGGEVMLRKRNLSLIDGVGRVK